LGEAAIAVLCDGMGGLEHGELASAVVVHAFEKWFLDELPFLGRDGVDTETLKDKWCDIAVCCNEKISAYSRTKNATMGTTLTSLLLLGENYYVVHVGDSRAYVMGAGIEQITNDQTFVAREVALGHMTQVQAMNDARRNVLLQCIGTGKAVEPEFFKGNICSGDSFLLCSDGFRHEITNGEIYEHCHKRLLNRDWRAGGRNESAKIMGAQLKSLIDVNKKRGEKDNISAVLVKAVGY
jgi:serine/threonine protein phosphatase PrpC